MKINNLDLSRIAEYAQMSDKELAKEFNLDTNKTLRQILQDTIDTNRKFLHLKYPAINPEVVEALFLTLEIYIKKIFDYDNINIDVSYFQLIKTSIQAYEKDRNDQQLISFVQDSIITQTLSIAIHEAVKKMTEVNVK